MYPLTADLVPTTGVISKGQSRRIFTFERVVLAGYLKAL